MDFEKAGIRDWGFGIRKSHARHSRAGGNPVLAFDLFAGARFSPQP
jgi:hypothetical protein